MDKVESDCVLCVQETDIIALGHCNHKTFCYQCMIKLRVISKIKTCPICKQVLDKIILTDNLNANFQDFEIRKLSSIAYSKEVKDVFYTDKEELKQKVEALNNYKCPISQCTSDDSYQNYGQLRNHLRDQHLRFFCDVCIEQKTCFLAEQLLYTEYQLRHHVNTGDFDEDGNIIFKHPYCKYCRKHFYDEDKFKQHLNIAHINCNMCTDRKFTFYKDHGSYEKHLKLSHYLCEETECKQMLVVFKTSGELDLHKQSAHCNDPRIKKLAQINVQQFAGFYEDPKAKKAINDKEGEDFTDQFISLQKTNMRGIVASLDDHQDEAIDFREFYYTEYNDDLDKQSDVSERELIQKEVYLEDIHFVKPQSIPHMGFDSFIRKCGQFFKNQKNKEDQLRKMIQMFESEKFSADNFVNDFVRMFQLKTGIRLLTFYMSMRDVREQKTMWKALDTALIKELRLLPRRNNNIITTCKTYSELFQSLLTELNNNLTLRINDGKLVNYNDTIMPKERIFQLIEVLRHVKTQEMGKFKFALNFGFSTQVLELIKQYILLDDVSRIQQHLSAISNHDLVPFYLYVNLSAKILRGEKIHKEKKDVNECVYQEYFQNNKKLFNQLQKPTNIESNKQQFLQKQVHHDSSGAQLNAEDFPSLPKTVKQEQPLSNQFYIKPQQPAQQQQKQQTQPQVQETKQQKKQKQQPQGKWQASGQAILQNQAAIEESFPVLDFLQNVPETKKPATTGPFQMDESFVPITTYQPVKSIEGTEWDSNPIIPKKNQQMKEVGKIQKKNKTIIQISGGFC